MARRCCACFGPASIPARCRAYLPACGDTERRGEPKRVRRERAALHHVKHELENFVERALIAVLEESMTWVGAVPHVGAIDLGINRIRIELLYPASGTPIRLTLEHHDGWLMAGFADEAQPNQTWLAHLTAQQAVVFRDALAGFYKLAGVDFIREQIRALLPEAMTWKLTRGMLIVRNSGGAEARYCLNDAQNLLTPAAMIGPLAQTLPPIPADSLFYGRCPIEWDDWVRIGKPTKKARVTEQDFCRR